jgi:hypothetical protein
MTMTAEQPELHQFAYSVKLETTAKGLVVPTVHVYADEPSLAREKAVALYVHTIADLMTHGFKSATEVKE